MEHHEASGLLEVAKRTGVRARLIREQTWFEFLTVGVMSAATVVIRALTDDGAASVFAGVALTIAAVWTVVRERRRRAAIGDVKTPLIWVASFIEGAALGIAAKSTFLGRIGYELTPSRMMVVAGALCVAALYFASARRRPFEVMVVVAGSISAVAAYAGVPQEVWPLALAATATVAALGLTQALEARTAT
jgi:hypothetical protein